MAHFVFRVGAARSTKVRREQVTFLGWDRDGPVSQLLLRLLRATGPDQLMFPYIYEQYRVCLAQVCESARFHPGQDLLWMRLQMVGT